MDDTSKDLTVPLEKNINIPTGGDDETISSENDPTEIKIPLGLLAFGLLVCGLYGFTQNGGAGAAQLLLAVGFGLIVEVGLGLVFCFIASFLLGITFGRLGPAILKLAAIIIVPYACCLFLQPWVGFFVKEILFWCLIRYLFDLEPIDVLWTAAILGFVDLSIMLTFMITVEPKETAGDPVVFSAILNSAAGCCRCIFKIA